MNIKSLAIKNNSDTDEPKVAYIEFEGEGVITAADIQADADIEIMNPEQVIATLSGGADSKFYMELTITNGRGYVSADKNKSDDLPDVYKRQTMQSAGSRCSTARRCRAAE